MPMEYKKGLIASLLYRVFTICSGFGKLHDEITFLKTIWQKNDFPLYFIDRCVKKVLDKLLIKKSAHKIASSNKKEVILPLIFIGKQSSQIKKKIMNIFRDCARGFKLKIAFSSPNRLKNGFTLKERVPREMDSLL